MQLNKIRSRLLSRFVLPIWLKYYASTFFLAEIWIFASNDIMEIENRCKLSFGILAHVDAGKTSITEQILYQVGLLDCPGSVDKGTAITDSLDVEKARGISVKSAALSFDYKQFQLNLIDTPGHSDFSSEISRALSVLNGVILVISAVEGVEAQTRHLWEILRKNSIPTIIFINKLDRIGADLDRVMDDIKLLHKRSILIQDFDKIATDKLALLSHYEENFDKGNSSFKEVFIELIADFDDAIMERYLIDDDISFSDLDNVFKKLVRTGAAIPVLAGSAKYGIGINELIESVTKFLPFTKGETGGNPIIRIFKIIQSNDKEIYAKVEEGSIKVRDSLKNPITGEIEKINAIKIPSVKGNVNIKEADAGDIVVIEGLKSAIIGQVWGDDDSSKSIVENIQPAITVQIMAQEENDYIQLAEALKVLYLEEPNLNFLWLKDEREFHIDVMGNIHMEILKQTLLDRFELETEFLNPTIIYKETPASIGYGYVEYTMPKPCWAVCKFKIEPLTRGKGVIYESSVSVDKIKQRYQNEVARTITSALKQGILGWEVTDLKIILVDGEDHEIHSRPSDFVIATPMGIMNGLQACGSRLLEPVMEFSLLVPEEKCGRGMSDITKMRGSFAAPVITNGFARIEGLIPLSSALDYQIEVSSYTSGKGRFATGFHSYQECDLALGKTRDYRGISPLDRSKYILKARKAIIEK